MADFFLNICRADEVAIARRLLRQIEQFYPESRVLIISENAALADYDWSRATYLQDRPLKSRGNIGRFLTRNYEAALDICDAATLVKLDPDTFIQERVELDDLDLAGHARQDVGAFGRLTIVCGGLIVYQRSTLQRILASELLRDPIYHCSARENPTIDHIYRRLNLSPTHLEVVNALYRRSQDARRWAIIHPVKTCDSVS